MLVTFLIRVLSPEKNEKEVLLPDVLDEFYHLESHLDTVVRMHGICIRHPRNAVVAITQDLDSHAFVHLEFENCRQSLSLFRLKHTVLSDLGKMKGIKVLYGQWSDNTLSLASFWA